MATSKGSPPSDGKGMQGNKARGYAPGGHGPHGGHHRKHFDQVSVNPVADHLRNNPGARNTIAGAEPQGSVGGM